MSNANAATRKPSSTMNPSRSELRDEMKRIAEGVDLVRQVFPNAKVTYAKEGREVGKRPDNSRTITLDQRA